MAMGEWVRRRRSEEGLVMEHRSESAASAVERYDRLVPGEPGIELFVREVRASGAREKGAPVLLLHGARVPGVASFDLPVPGGSLAADLALAGQRVFVMDARGYGGSTRLAAMEQPPAVHPPLVRSHEVVRDVAAVVEAIRRETGETRVALLGWATGGHWLGFYASLHPERVDRLIVHNSLYGGSPDHPSLGRGSALEDPARPGRFNVGLGAYRRNDAASLLRSWDESIPLADKAAWRDPAVAAAYVATAVSSDPLGPTTDPPAFRAPSGALEDSFSLAVGRQLWDAGSITAATLIVRSERDFWSRPEDCRVLAAHLTYAARVETLTIPDATHHVHLDRPERGRDRFLAAVTAFLGRVG
jgi:pimeloyl-ACP methyl ester carboxylesterase